MKRKHCLGFKDWLQQDESTAFTRRRKAADSGLMPEIPDAETHRHSTFVGKKKKKNKKKCPITERTKRPIVDRTVDSFLSGIESLKPEINALMSAIMKKREEAKKKDIKPSKTNDNSDGAEDDQKQEKKKSDNEKTEKDAGEEISSREDRDKKA